MKITYLGHSCFEIITNNNKIIIDPFLVLSPNYDYSEVKNIFVTHLPKNACISDINV